MRSPPPLLVLLLALAAATSAFAGGGPVNEPLLGIAGKPDRFERQTGQESQIRQLFLGWGQGSTWGSPFADLFAGLKPIPMIHIGTDQGRARTEAITPAQIAAGRGDSYLIALNQAIAAFGGPIYVRVLAEMNNPKNLYAPTRPNGASKGASHSPAAYKQAFRRAYLILHGGVIDAKLRRLGLKPVGRDLAVNPTSSLTVIWNPIAGFDAQSPRPAQQFYPGDAFVDMVGNDIFAGRRGVASHAANEALYRAHPSKPYALPEWGLSVDDPGFVRKICRFLATASRTRLAVFYDARPGSPYDLGSKPGARAEYRRCITPIGAVAEPTLTAAPARGDAPLAVTFTPRAALATPVVRWEVVFGDGKVQQGTGAPPASLSYTYAKDGLYTAVFVAYLQPPFGGVGMRHLAQAQVRVGKKADQLLRLTAARRTGKAPFTAGFRASAAAAATSWEFVPGDGTSRSGEGRPPRLLGHTYRAAGTYRAILIVQLGPGEKVLASAEVRARG